MNIYFSKVKESFSLDVMGYKIDFGLIFLMKTSNYWIMETLVSSYADIPGRSLNVCNHRDTQHHNDDPVIFPSSTLFHFIFCALIE